MKWLSSHIKIIFNVERYFVSMCIDLRLGSYWIEDSETFPAKFKRLINAKVIQCLHTNMIDGAPCLRSLAQNNFFIQEDSLIL